MNFRPLQSGLRVGMPAIALSAAALTACKTREEQSLPPPAWQADHNAQAGFDPVAAYALGTSMVLGFQAVKLAGYWQTTKNPWHRMRNPCLNGRKIELHDAYRSFNIADGHAHLAYLGPIFSGFLGAGTAAWAAYMAVTYGGSILADYKMWSNLPLFLLGTSAALGVDVALYATRLKTFLGYEKAVAETRKKEAALRAGTAAEKLAQVLAPCQGSILWFSNTDITNKAGDCYDWLFGTDGLLTGKAFFELSQIQQIAVIQTIVSALRNNNVKTKNELRNGLITFDIDPYRTAILDFFCANFSEDVKTNVKELKNTMYLHTRVEGLIAECAAEGDWDQFLKGIAQYPFGSSRDTGYDTKAMAVALWTGLNDHPLPTGHKRAQILAVAKAVGRDVPRLSQLITIIEAVDARAKGQKLILPEDFNPFVEVRACNYLHRSGKRVHTEVLAAVSSTPPKDNITVTHITWRMYFEKNPDQLVELYRAANTDTIREAITLVNYFFDKDEDTPPQTPRQAVEDMLTLIRAMTLVNASPIRELACKVCSKFNASQRLAELNLLANISRRYKARTLLLVDAVAKGFENNLFADIADLATNGKTHAENILKMIAECGSFSALLYVGYVKEGKTFLDKHRPIARDIIDDKLGPNELGRLAADFTNDYLLFVSQSAIPASSESYVKGSDVLALLDKGIKVGDYRNHVPQKLRGRRFEFAIPVVGFAVREGAKVDPDGKVQGLYKELSDPVADIDSARVALVQKIALGLKDPDQFDKEAIISDFLKIAAAHFGLKEALPRVDQITYNLITIIEEQLGEKDKLPALLTTILGDVPDGFFAKEVLAIDNADDLVSQILATAAAAKEHKDKKREQKELADLIEAFSLDELQVKVFSHARIDVALVQKLRGAKKTRELTPDHARFALARNLLLPAANLLQAEKAKFVQTSTGTRHFYIGARKGPAMILAGTSSGVCVGADDFVFNNKDYFPIPIVDAETETVIGFCQGVQTTEADGAHLEVVSINPSVEAMSTLPAEPFYDGIIGALQEMAIVGGYEEAHLPFDPVIHTNRKALAPVIRDRAKKYHRRQITKVVWNKKYPGYNYTDVYVFWQRHKRGET